jgi:hypothetical protein
MCYLLQIDCRSIHSVFDKTTFLDFVMTGAEPAPDTLCLYNLWRWTKSKNVVLSSTIHHRQNPLELNHSVFVAQKRFLASHSVQKKSSSLPHDTWAGSCDYRQITTHTDASWPFWVRWNRLLAELKLASHYRLIRMLQNVQSGIYLC